MSGLLLQAVARHDRWFLTAGIALVIALAWAWLLAGAGMSIGGLEMTRMSLGENAHMDMTMTSVADWSPSYVLVMFLMWWIMMIAMMLPSAAPTILLAAAINRNADPDRSPYGATGAFAVGYLFGWGLFSAAAVALQWVMAESGLLSDMLISKSNILSAGILISAGIWQFTPLKNACLRHCQSPVQFLTQNRRPGHHGAFTMGLHHSLFCVSCCWFLMLLLFVGGVMNLIWVGALAVYVWLEKTLPAGSHLSRFTGIALIAGGILVMI
jgi:predicted metal-binding membrane protein